MRASLLPVFVFALVALSGTCPAAVSVGVECVGTYPNYNAVHSDQYDLENLPSLFNMAYGFWRLMHAGAPQDFYYVRADCWEKDLRDSSQGGLDNSYADNVDIFYIATHGGNPYDYITLAYDCLNQYWMSDSRKWCLGDRNLEWLAMYACSTLPLNRIARTCRPFFHGLHEALGAYAPLYACWTTDECGEDFAQNLLDGDRVADAWLDAVDDWLMPQAPVAISAERRETWGGSMLAHMLSATRFPGSAIRCTTHRRALLCFGCRQPKPLLA